LASAKSSLDRLYGALRESAVAADASLQHPQLDELEGYLLDDLNTPQAMSVLHGLASEINKATDGEKLQLQKVLRKAGSFIGLLQQDAEAWFKWAPASSAGGLSDAEIDQLIQERIDAKQAKNFARADEIRNQLKEQGIILEDSKD